MAASLTMKELLESGVHFGHPTRRWNPKMKRYIYGARNGIYIIDLHQTIKLFEDALKYVQTLAEENGSILFVGTKKQAQMAVREAAQRSRQYFVTERWMGGMLTNWNTMRDRIARLQDLKRRFEDGYLDRLPKKEAAQRQEEHDRLELYFEGIKDMQKMPDAMFVVDLKKEQIAVAEARKLNIPIIAVVDTNCDPDEADYVIPGNDDAIRAIRLIAGKIADTIAEVRQFDVAEETEEAEPEAAGDESIAAMLEVDATDPRIVMESPAVEEAPLQLDEVAQELIRAYPEDAGELVEALPEEDSSDPRRARGRTLGDRKER